MCVACSIVITIYVIITITIIITSTITISTTTTIAILLPSPIATLIFLFLPTSSGESGSGKTETSKYVMAYIACTASGKLNLRHPPMHCIHHKTALETPRPRHPSRAFRARFDLRPLRRTLQCRHHQSRSPGELFDNQPQNPKPLTLPTVQPHPRGLWQRAHTAQRQLESLREIH